MNIVLISSHSSNNQAVFELTTKNHSEYCKRHGYTYMPVEEPYHPKLDIPFVRKLLTDYDVVVNIGCDVVIQHPKKLIEDLWMPGLVIGVERGGTLNGDLLIISKHALALLDEIEKLHPSVIDTQTAINRLFGKRADIFVKPMLQIAAKNMNPRLDYTDVCYEDYFAVHYHTIGKVPLVEEKIKGLSADLNI